MQRFVFQGYASVFNQVDDGRDMVLPGAFARSLAHRMPDLLWQHEAGRTVGVVEQVQEDERGLWVRGSIHIDTPEGRRMASQVKTGLITGLSIGFRATRAQRTQLKGVRLLREVDLLEISLVRHPMQRLARIQSSGLAQSLERLASMVSAVKSLTHALAA